MPDGLLFGLIGAVIGLLVGGALVAARMSSRVTALSSDRARLEAELQAAEVQKVLLVQSQAQLRETFGSLSRDALLENRQDFLQNADALLAPVRESLNKVQDRLVTVDRDREGSYRAVAAQISELTGAHKELRDAAEGLARSLRNPNARGKWGEFQLRRVVELAGMVSHCDFDEKPTITTDEGRFTPDLVVNLPGDGAIVVDAKVPIDGYLSAAEARTDAERDARLAAHLRQVKDHIRALAKKEYWKLYKNSPQFVIMFIPLEPLFAAAIEQEPTLLDQAAGLNVVPASPLTLLALLKTVSLGWKQEQVAKNAEEIQLAGRDLYDRLRTMVGHLEMVGRNIKLAGDSYDKFVGSLEQRVLPGARKLNDLGVHSTEEIESPEPLRLALRPATRQEDAPLFDEVMLRQRLPNDDASD